jgi:hypothetical protein
VTNTLFQQALNFTGWSGTSGLVTKTGTCVGDPNTVCIDYDSSGSNVDIIQANAGTGPVSLAPGSTAIIYFKMSNGTLTTLDSGSSTTLNIFAGKTGAPQSITIEGKTNTG